LINDSTEYGEHTWGEYDLYSNIKDPDIRSGDEELVIIKFCFYHYVSTAREDNLYLVYRLG